jgi:integrase
MDAPTRPWYEVFASAFGGPGAATAPVAEIVRAFLAWSVAHHKPSTSGQYEWFGEALIEDCGRIVAVDFRPIDVTRWVAARGWAGAQEYNARRYAFRYFSWAVREGLLRANPLSGMPRPRPLPRRRALGEGEYLTLIRATDSDLRPLLFALRQTGARPQELRELTWPQVRDDHLRLDDHKTVGRTRKPRIIHLAPVVQRFLAVLRRRSRSDHVFLNGRGEPWTANALRLRISRLRDKLGLADDVCAYLIRHAFGTNAVLNGVDVATVAELMGHASTEVTTSVYIHLAEQTSHLQDAAARAAAPRSRPPGRRPWTPASPPDAASPAGA